MKSFLKWTCGSLLALILFAAVIGWVLRNPLLSRAGHFMAPQGDYAADVVILEGNDYIRSGFIDLGMSLLQEGKIQRLVVVLHRIAPAHRPFGIDGTYPEAVRRKLLERGLTPEQFQIIVSPIRHPVTLKEAQFVLKALEGEKISSAILVAPSFHTRRSYLAYAYSAQARQIKIYPLACFTENHSDVWWEDPGQRRDFVTEAGKLLYYLAARHLPLQFEYP